DGNAALEPGAVVCRVASSFVRFGHFQMLAARGETELLRQFTDFVVRTEFPELLAGRDPQTALTVDDYVGFFRAVCERTVTMVVEWLRVGFVHGVMNTDNMSITGLTIDYGPYGWLDDYDPDWTPNTTDAGQRRYRFGQQAAIAQWNLMQLGSALLALVPEAALLESELSAFAQRYDALWPHMMARKLGLDTLDESIDRPLFAQLEQTLRLTETDMTLFYQCLGTVTAQDSAARALERLGAAFYLPETVAGDVEQGLQTWLSQYLQRLRDVDPQQRAQRMRKANPKYVLRNYLAQLAIDDAQGGDFTKVQELLQLLRRPYVEQPEFEHYAAKRPDWARTRVGCSQLSCSS
ncbi:MAG: protein adenylyltransferase SelO family protein, partial [Pseudomonadales bacterium]